MELASQGVSVFITGRNKEKGKLAQDRHENLSFIQWDLSDWSKLKEVTAQINHIDYLALNAGGMPANFETNKYGIEDQFSSQLYAHYFLLRALKNENKLNDTSRCVWMTSGGMYLKSLDLSLHDNTSDYDKVDTYANVKRAQITLLKRISEELSPIQVYATHPGWVDTPGVEIAIPKFYEKMKKRLRTPIQGADTMLWLFGTKTKVESGEFYFDRKKVKKHFFWFTKKSDNLAKRLFSNLNKDLYEKYYISDDDTNGV